MSYDNLQKKAAFVIPHYTEDFSSTEKSFKVALKSCLDQTDKNCFIIIVDDASPCEQAQRYLHGIQNQYQGKVIIIRLPINLGPGNARNFGVKRAHSLGVPFILFMDSDDASHPERVKVTRREFINNPHVGVVYHPFIPVDENSNEIHESNLTPSILSILNSYQKPLQGRDIWIDLASQVGYSNTSSSTSVLTEIAMSQPFPIKRIAEDGHTWMRYSAHGAYFHFINEVPSHYRLKAHGASSTSRDAFGKESFYTQLFQSALESLHYCISLSMQKGSINHAQSLEIEEQFYNLYSKVMVDNELQNFGENIKELQWV